MKRLTVLISLILSFALSSMGQGVADSSKKEKTPSQKEVQQGNLFSAILFANTPLGHRWGALGPEAEKLFPALKLKHLSDLHVTIVYIGKEWKPENLDLLRKAMAVHLTDTIHLTPEITSFGRNNQVVVAELKGVPEAFQAQLIAVKAKLNADGLKKPDFYDTAFRAHVTLAESRENPPTEQQKRELAAFREWIEPRLDLPTLHLLLTPSTPIQLMLAGATRQAPLPEYITVEDFLKNTR